ncbi:MAG: tellurite resistance TerB family protein [Microvirga sp.]|nr:tellurite resistance TerB family protein [Microvirga sp.]
MDVKRLLEGFLGQVGGTRAGAPREGGQTGPASQGGQIQDMIAKGLGGAGGLGGLGGLGGSLPGGLAGGAAAGGLMALLLGSKQARKLGGKALTYGGLAVVGGLAYKAWRDYNAAKGAGGAAPATGPIDIARLPPPPPGGAFDLTAQTDAQGEDMRLTLVRAMISAAKADGHIDSAENAAIQQQITNMSLAPDEKAFLFDQLNAPSDPIAIARLAGGEEQGAEIYLASALAVDADTPEEKRYLERLGDALRLPEALRAELDRHAQAAKAG